MGGEEWSMKRGAGAGRPVWAWSEEERGGRHLTEPALRANRRKPVARNVFTIHWPTLYALHSLPPTPPTVPIVTTDYAAPKLLPVNQIETHESPVPATGSNPQHPRYI